MSLLLESQNIFVKITEYICSHIYVTVQSISVQRVEARMGEIPAAPDIWPKRQQTGNEAFWLKEGADEAKGWLFPFLLLPQILT